MPDKIAIEIRILRKLAVVAKRYFDGLCDREALQKALDTCNIELALEGLGGGGGCVDSGLALPGTPPEEQILKTSQNKRAKIEKRGTWLSPFAAAWVARFGVGSSAPWGRLAKELHALVEQFGADAVLIRWKNYLASSQPQYVSPTRFASTYGSWENPARRNVPGEVPYQEPDESIDAYIVRLARLGF